MFEFKKDVFFFWLGIGARGGGGVLLFFLGVREAMGKKRLVG